MSMVIQCRSKATEVAAQMGSRRFIYWTNYRKKITDLLWIPGMNSMQATVRFKIVDVGSAKLIAADNAGGAAPSSIQKGSSRGPIDKVLSHLNPKS